MSGIYNPKDPYMQNMGTFGSQSQGAILGAPSHTKLGFAIPPFQMTSKLFLDIVGVIITSKLNINFEYFSGGLLDPPPMSSTVK